MADYRVSDSPSSQGRPSRPLGPGGIGVTTGPAESSAAPPWPPAQEITVFEFNYTPLIY